MSLKTFKWDAGKQRALFLISFSTVRRQVISRRPLLHFPYGVQYKAVFVMECFVIFFSVKIWSIRSIQPLSLLKPACSSCSLRSTASERRFMMTCVRILLGVDNNVMPRQLLHSDRAPYFGILMIIPRFLHQGFSFCLSQTVLKSDCKMLAVVTASVLNSSALRRSCQIPWGFLREFMAAIISFFFWWSGVNN